MPPQKSVAWPVSPLGRACSISSFLLYTLTLVLSIIQALSTLTAGVIVGLIFIWKVGLVGLGIFRHFLYGLFIDADCLV